MAKENVHEMNNQRNKTNPVKEVPGQEAIFQDSKEEVVFDFGLGEIKITNHINGRDFETTIQDVAKEAVWTIRDLEEMGTASFVLGEMIEALMFKENTGGMGEFEVGGISALAKAVGYRIENICHDFSRSGNKTIMEAIAGLEERTRQDGIY